MAVAKSITVSVPSYLAGSPTLYDVIVSMNGNSHELKKRYSDFLRLAKDAETELGEAVPVAPPAKSGWFQSSDLEQRRVGLENMLRAIVRAPLFVDSLAVGEFLELAKLQRQPDTKSADWMGSTTAISDALAAAKSAEPAARRQLCLNAKVLLSALQKQLDQPNHGLGAREKLRRQSQLDALFRQMSQL